MNETVPRFGRRTALRGSAVLTALGVAGRGSNAAIGPEAIAGQTPDAQVEMQQVQAAYGVSGGGGSGTLRYRGRSYPFVIASGGYGGIGASTLDAVGDVFNLPSLRDFPGAYAQARYGAVVGSVSTGELWLQNPAGVIMRLRARRTGLMLSLGGDAVVISMAQ